MKTLHISLEKRGNRLRTMRQSRRNQRYISSEDYRSLKPSKAKRQHNDTLESNGNVTSYKQQKYCKSEIIAGTLNNQERTNKHHLTQATCNSNRLCAWDNVRTQWVYLQVSTLNYNGPYVALVYYLSYFPSYVFSILVWYLKFPQSVLRAGWKDYTRRDQQGLPNATSTLPVLRLCPWAGNSSTLVS